MVLDGTAIVIAAIVAVPPTFVGAVVPLLIKWFEKMERDALRAEDMRRRDDIALKVDEATKKAMDVAKQTEAATLLVKETLAKTTEDAAKAAKDTNEKLVEVAKVQNVIHTLVNSQLTQAKQESYDANLELLKQLKEAKPTPEIAARIKVVEANIAELVAVLADRKASQRLVEAQQKTQVILE